MNSENLTRVGDLINDCKAGSGRSLVFFYRGSRTFFVHIFDAMGGEIEYFIPRQPNFHVIKQGIGVKIYIIFHDT